ncbi:MAG TPA: FkbM family methyltransferase [Chloroflexota bacterium]|nr:FkbM family methyltransferase [Chloroflexota bacterium]
MVGWLRLKEQLGIARSLLMYYGVPGRYGRMRQFYAQFIQPGDLCFDIGAHVGNRLRVWAALGARVVAAEPQPQLMRWLKWLYGRHPHITLLEQAVGAEPGTATLHISQRTPTVTTLSRAWMTAVQRDPTFAHVSWDTAVNVPVTTLDALMAQYGRPAFCKIDVEGYELEVLRGLSQPIPGLSFEYIPAAMEIATACVARLAELGPYEFNYAPGESHRLQSAHWLSAAEMLSILAQIKEGSGDVYGRVLVSR